MGAMLEIAEFLLARIAEDEAVAQEAESARKSERLEGIEWSEFNDRYSAYAADQQERWSPARVLAECEAKRRIAKTCQGYEWEHENAAGYSHVLRLLALPYADHPDFRDEWRP